jgi:hypothetical protein
VKQLGQRQLQGATLQEQAERLREHLIWMAQTEVSSFSPEKLQEWIQGINQGRPLELNLRLLVSPSN